MQDDEALRRVALETQRHQAGAGAGGRQRFGVFVGLDERQIARAGKIDRRHVGNQVRQRGGLAGLRSRQRNDFSHCQTRRAIKEAAIFHY